MTSPKQPDDHPPPEEAGRDEQKRDPTGEAPNGIPPEATQGKAKGSPSSDREATETAASPKRQ